MNSKKVSAVTKSRLEEEYNENEEVNNITNGKDFKCNNRATNMPKRKIPRIKVPKLRIPKQTKLNIQKQVRRLNLKKKKK